MEKNLTEKIISAYCKTFWYKEKDLVKYKHKILSDFAKTFYKGPLGFGRRIRNFFGRSNSGIGFVLSGTDGGLGPSYSKEQLAEKLVTMKIAKYIEEGKKLVPELVRTKFPSWSFLSKESYFQEFLDNTNNSLTYRMFLENRELGGEMD